MGSEVKFNIFARLLTIENIIFMFRNCAPIQFLLLGIACGALKSPIIAHRHLCLDMFEGLKI